MRVALIANTSWYLRNFRSALIDALCMKGHEVICLAPSDEYTADLRRLGARCRHLPMSQRGRNPLVETASLLSLGMLLWRMRPNMVLSYTTKCNLYVGLCRRMLGFGQTANVSGLGEAFDRPGITRAVVSALYRHALHGAQRVFFQNNEDMVTIANCQRLLPRSAWQRLPGSGVDLVRFVPRTGRQFADNGKRVFLMYGRLVPKKGYALYLEAARALNGLAEFRILGIEDNSRPASRALYERILQASHDGVITFRPRTDDVRPEVWSADVVVLPSTYNEGVPRTLLEALACGKPIITTDWKGCRDTVDSGENGYLVKPHDVADLVSRMKTFIDAPEDQILTMGSASRAKAEREFDERVVVNAYIQEVERCVTDS